MRHSTLYFHIGFPKTASTFFQEDIMPIISSMNCFPNLHGGSISSRDPWDSTFYRFFQHSPAIWDSKVGRGLFTELFGNPGSNSVREKDALISDENVYISGSRDPFFVKKHMEEFKRLSHEWGFKKFKVLASFRRQDTWIASAYSQRSHLYKGASQEHFEQKVRTNIDPSKNYFRSRIDLDYELQHRLLVDVIGEDNLFMVPYELMKNDIYSFFRRWFMFLGIPDEGEDILRQFDNDPPGKRNVGSLGEDTWKIKERFTPDAPYIPLRPGRVFNALGIDQRRLVLRWPDFEREEEIRLTPTLREEILNCYESSNRTLARRLDADLAQFNYH